MITLSFGFPTMGQSLDQRQAKPVWVIPYGANSSTQAIRRFYIHSREVNLNVISGTYINQLYVILNNILRRTYQFCKESGDWD